MKMFFSRKQKVYLSQVFTFTFHMLCDGVRQTQTADLQTPDLQTLQTRRLADLQTCGLADTFGTHGEGAGG